MGMRPLSQGAVAPFGRRRGPLKGVGLLGRPRWPRLKHSGHQLPRERVPVTRGLTGL